MKLNWKKYLLIGGSVVALLAVAAAITFIIANPAKQEPVVTDPEPIKDVEVVEVKPQPDEPEVFLYPLTGEEAADKSETLRRALSVKIENTPEARPQLGIASADVVYETITESGISRMNCIYQSIIPDEVGPVRSGRNSDVTLVPQYDALFFMSGANDVVLSEIAAAGLADLSHGKASELYYRVDYRYAPHNLYLHLSQAYAVAEAHGFSIMADTPRALEFGVNTNVSTSEASSITVPFSSYYIAEWTWSDSEHAYLRSMDGPTIDAADSSQVNAENVVVMWVTYTLVLGGPTQAIDMNSGGEAALFTEGKRIDVTWTSDGSNPPRFKDANGTSIKLTPGKTWFQVLNYDQSISVS